MYLNFLCTARARARAPKELIHLEAHLWALFNFYNKIISLLKMNRFLIIPLMYNFSNSVKFEVDFYTTQVSIFFCFYSNLLRNSWNTWESCRCEKGGVVKVFQSHSKGFCKRLNYCSWPLKIIFWDWIFDDFRMKMIKSACIGLLWFYKCTY